ncbi:hypothetical protein EW145_g3999 [Phellinidium pouzarii]|uniref:DNA polymerase epsilon subunit D n=1 Tax=Phellinidium pouzarii TaxID=167371 RepID=A0A4V3XCN2_9AGAM|nr:hypothetical protein EW145_g3999 [Phellinidium pouzarii]
MPRKDSNTTPASAQAQQDAASDSIDNYELPKTLVTRIAKSAIPETSKLQKDTVTALMKGSTVFINYLAATAHDVSTSRQHKSVSAADVLKALELIQFGDMVDTLQHELQIYRENLKISKKNSNKSASGTGESASARSKNKNTSSAKGKGKERATGIGPSPLSVDASASVSGEADEEMGDEGEGDGGEGEGEGEEGDEEAPDDEEEDELADDVDDEDEGEPGEEEIVDAMAVDEEELLQDQRRADLKTEDAGAFYEEDV